MNILINKGKKLNEVVSFFSSLINIENKRIDQVMEKLIKRDFTGIKLSEIENFFQILKKRIKFFRIIKKDINQMRTKMNKKKQKHVIRDQNIDLQEFLQLPNIKSEEIDKLEKVFESYQPISEDRPISKDSIPMSKKMI